MIPHARALAGSASTLSIPVIKSPLLRRPEPTTSLALCLPTRLLTTLGTAVDMPAVARLVDDERLATTATLKRDSSQDPSTGRQKLDPGSGHLDTGIVGITILVWGGAYLPAPLFPTSSTQIVDRAISWHGPWGPVGSVILVLKKAGGDIASPIHQRQPSPP